MAGRRPGHLFIILAISSFRREPAQVVMGERAADARIKSAHDVLQKPSWPGEDPAIFLSSLQYRHSGESPLKSSWASERQMRGSRPRMTYYKNRHGRAKTRPSFLSSLQYRHSGESPLKSSCASERQMRGSSPRVTYYKNRHGRAKTRPSFLSSLQYRHSGESPLKSSCASERQMRGSSPRMTYYKNRHGRAKTRPSFYHPCNIVIPARASDPASPRKAGP